MIVSSLRCHFQNHYLQLLLPVLLQQHSLNNIHRIKLLKVLYKVKELQLLEKDYNENNLNNT